MKTNQFRAMMLVLLMAVVSLGMVNAQAITVSGTVMAALISNWLAPLFSTLLIPTINIRLGK